MIRSLRHGIAALATGLLLCAPATAQEAQGGGTKQSRSGGAAQTAQVGAGTTNGSTTGYSGRKGGGGNGNKPATPSLCDAYKGAVHDSCMFVVLGQAHLSQKANPQ